MQKRTTDEPDQSLHARIFGNAYLLLTLTMLFWAGNTIAGRAIAGTVPPLTLAWLRWTLAAAIILPIAWPHLKRDWPVIRRNWPILSLLGTLGCGIFISLYYTGLTMTTALNGLIINSAVPILIPLAVFVLYRETLNRWQTLGILLSLIGVIAVITKGDLAILVRLDLNRGDLFVLAAMSVFAIYTALLRKQPKMHWISFGACCFIVAAIVTFPLFLSEALMGETIKPTFGAFFAVLYVGTLPSVMAQIMYIRGVELIGGNRAGAFLNLIPLFGALLAMIILGERLYAFHLVGFGLIICGVWLAQRQKRTVSAVQ
ncbi:MAG TPA: DMT family transporter [Hyphomicrobiales bacterium]|nr:DMT family transporter [Hyphomicrobiales bacterium]